MSSRSLMALGMALLHAPAFASSASSDLSLSLTAPLGVRVYATGRYQVTVRNVGNKDASNVSVNVQLPKSNTTPIVPLATVVALDSRCALSGTRLTCALGLMKRNTTLTVFADLKLPYSTRPLSLSASASTSSAENSYLNNSAQHTASLGTYDVTVAPGPAQPVINRHCTGTNLSSFQECISFPSSISSHEALYHDDHTISFPTAGPDYSGTWAQPDDDRLVVQYFELGVLIASFDGRGVNADCFEGRTTFYDAPFGTPSTYMSMYNVCLQ